jgi:predicted metal-dependent phosphoesterase TrpH
VASALVEAGVVPSVDAAFSSLWLADGGRAYVEKYALEPVHAIRLVRDAGGTTVFAHPAATKRGRTVTDEQIAMLGDAGLHGLEADHPDHDEAARARVKALAASLGMVATGSSDYHGTRKTVVLGQCTTDPEAFAALLPEYA